MKQTSIHKTILDLCGGTGSWSKPYADAGYEVVNVTLPDSDVRWFKKPKYDVYGILCAPPCDHFSVSGAQYWPAKDKDGRTLEAISIMDACIRIVMACNPVFWALENPVGRMRHFLGSPALVFSPCDYGDPYTKKTLLWGKFNKPALRPVEPIRVCSQGSWLMRLGGKTEKTKLLRSMTPAGFANAFFEANK